MFILERIKYLFSGSNLGLIVLTFALALIFEVTTSKEFRLKNTFLLTIVSVIVVYVFFTPLHTKKCYY